MTTFLGSDVWQGLRSICERRGPKRVAVAYYSSDVDLQCVSGDTLIVNATPEAIASRQTSASVLLRAARRGAQVYSHSKLHAKFILLPHVLVAGSANLSSASHRLREVGIITRDRKALERARAYFELLRREAALLSIQKLKDLEAIRLAPVRGVPRSNKPSLLEAIRDGLPALRDVTFSWYGGDPTMSTSTVEAGARGAHLPIPSSRAEWTWYETEYRGGALRHLRKVPQGMPLVTWPCEVKEDGSIARFNAHDSYAEPWLGAYPARSVVVSLVGMRSVPTPFNLKQDRRVLAKILTAGLKSAPASLCRAVNNDTGLIPPARLQELYTLGR